MNDEFEALPFAAGEMAMEDEGAGDLAGEWLGEDEGEFEEERGGRGGGGRGGRGVGGAGRGGLGRGGSRPVYRPGGKPGRGPVARPGRPSRPGGKPKPGPRPRPWPGRWPAGPYWGPFYGGGAGGVMVSEPMGYPLPSQDAPPDDAQEPPAAFEPIDLPAAGGGNAGDGDSPQEEMPGTLRKVIASLAEAAPQFRHVGRLNEVKRLNLPTGPGFYLITFRKGNAWRAYNGQTGNLRQRLRQHLLGATVLGFDVPTHHVYIAESARPERARQNIEHAINRAMRQHHDGVLTNQVDELEMESLGWH